MSIGCPSGVEPELRVPQTLVLTITPWAPYHCSLVNSLLFITDFAFRVKYFLYGKIASILLATMKSFSESPPIA